jgi:hypothetical protein
MDIGYPCNAKNAKMAIVNMSHECLEIMVENGCPLSGDMIDLAIKSGIVESLKCLVLYGCRMDYPRHPIMAASYGALECLKFLKQKGLKLPPQILGIAASYGHLNIVVYAIKNKHELTMIPHDIIKYGHLECLVALDSYMEKLILPLNTYYLASHAPNGSGVWSYVVANFNLEFGVELLESLIAKDQCYKLKMLIYQYTKHKKLEDKFCRPFFPGMMCLAIKYGSLKCLKLLYARWIKKMTRQSKIYEEPLDLHLMFRKYLMTHEDIFGHMDILMKITLSGDRHANRHLTHKRRAAYRYCNTMLVKRPGKSEFDIAMGKKFDMYYMAVLDITRKIV